MVGMGSAPPLQDKVAVAPDLPQLKALTNLLADRSRRLSAMRTDAVMKYTSAGRTVKAREVIVVKRPAELRVEALSPLGVALVVAASRSKLSIYDPSNNTFYRGAANAATLDRFANIPVPPRQAVRLLMGLLPDESVTAAPPASLGNRNGKMVASYKLPGGMVEELAFDGDHLAMVRLLDAAGESAYEVRYGDYFDIGGIVFPHRIDASFRGGETRLQVTYSHLIVNPSVDDTLFVLAPAAGAREMRIGSDGSNG